MKTYLLFLLFSLASCKQDCKDLPTSFKNYEDAKNIVLGSSFKYTDNCDVSESSFITSADYYSCDGLRGYFILGMDGKKYIFQNLPIKKWQNFKDSESKGRYFNCSIKGRYSLKTSTN